MKSVVCIEGEGKVKDGGLRDLTDYPGVEEVNTLVALIQALIPLRLQAAGEALGAEVTRLAGLGPQLERGNPRLRPLEPGAGLDRPPGSEDPHPLPTRAGSPPQRGGPAADVPAAPATAAGRCWSVPETSPRIELLELRGLCRPGPGGLRPERLHSLAGSSGGRVEAQALQERRLECYDFVVLVLDAKSCAAEQLDCPGDYPNGREGAPRVRSERHGE